jgi:hypothetical protein
MTFEREWFTTYKSIVPWKVYMGDDTILEAIDKGRMKGIMQVGGKMLFTTIIQIFCRNPNLGACYQGKSLQGHKPRGV